MIKTESLRRSRTEFITESESDKTMAEPWNNKRYPEIGATHAEAVRIRKLLGDGASGEEGLCVLDGYWALEKAANAGMKILTFVFCPELWRAEKRNGFLKDTIFGRQCFFSF